MRLQIILLILWLCVIACAGGPKYRPVEWTETTAENYGYAMENPIRLGYHKDAGTNIQLIKTFISCLRTKSGESLNILARGSLNDTKYKAEYEESFLGMHKRGALPRGGMLDNYILVTDTEADTVSLYFDIYHAEPIAIPSGLNYACPIDSTQDPLMRFLQMRDRPEF